VTILGDVLMLTFVLVAMFPSQSRPHPDAAGRHAVRDPGTFLFRRSVASSYRRIRVAVARSTPIFRST